MVCFKKVDTIDINFDFRMRFLYMLEYHFIILDVSTIRYRADFSPSKTFCDSSCISM